MSRMRADRTLINVSVFTVVMLLVATSLVVVFGEFRFGSDKGYHATFTDASRLKSGEDVRIAGVPVGTVDGCVGVGSAPVAGAGQGGFTPSRLSVKRPVKKNGRCCLERMNVAAWNVPPMTACV